MINGTSARTRPRESRSLALLKRLVATSLFEPEVIARALGTTTETLTRYLSDLGPIPLEQQLCLASFVIERAPGLARLGHQLRGQAAAALAIQNRLTETHLQPPPTVRFY